jgi:rubrerythrin
MTAYSVDGKRRTTVSQVTGKSESDIILTAIAVEKEGYTHLAAAARACTCPKARRLYNQLALDELKHILALVSLLDGVAEDSLNQLDLTFPADVLEPLAQSEDAILRSTMMQEARSQTFFSSIAGAGSREALLSLFEVLRAEEEGHLTRLRTMLYGLEADRPVVAKWLRSIRRLVPAEYLH